MEGWGEREGLGGPQQGVRRPCQRLVCRCGAHGLFAGPRGAKALLGLCIPHAAKKRFRHAAGSQCSSAMCSRCSRGCSFHIGQRFKKPLRKWEDAEFPRSQQVVARSLQCVQEPSPECLYLRGHGILGRGSEGPWPLPAALA